MMRKITICLLLSILILGCLKIDNPVIQPVNYTSKVRFVNLSRSGVGVNVLVDGTSLGGVSYGEASNYFDVNSGSRVVVFSYQGGSDTIKRSFEPEKKYSVFYVDRDNVVYAVERNTFDDPYPKDAAVVRFMHFSPDVDSVKVLFNIAGKDSAFSGVAFTKGTPYIIITSFPIKFTVVSGTDTLVKAQDSGITSAGRYSFVIYGLRANLKTKLFKED